jgi:hypothetical protein
MEYTFHKFKDLLTTNYLIVTTIIIIIIIFCHHTAMAESLPHMCDPTFLGSADHANPTL